MLSSLDQYTILPRTIKIEKIKKLIIKFKGSFEVEVNINEKEETVFIKTKRLGKISSVKTL